MTSLRFPARLGCLLAASALFLAACGDFQETHNPTVSDLTLSPDHMGDLVTVLIDIDDRAQLQNATGRSRSSSTGVDDPDILNFDTSTDSGQLIGLSSSSSSEGEGSIRRNETIRLRVAALVIQTLPNGNFVIAGRQEVKVNNELRELRIAGIIRQSDINVGNTIDYDKIAEARITYGGRGQISTVQTARYGQDALEVFLPY
jgi:flagellar L-ring protein precursor FlgH